MAVLVIVYRITGFTKKPIAKMFIFSAWIGFSSRSQGVPHSL